MEILGILIFGKVFGSHFFPGALFYADILPDILWGWVFC